MDNVKVEQCFYCDKVAEYNDLVSNGYIYSISGVCSKHVKNYVEGS